MEILGIGPMELILILIVALMVFGPDKLPQMGAKLGRAMREMRKATRAISDEINATRAAVENPARELAEPFQEVAGMAKSASAVAAAARNPGAALRDSVLKELNPPAQAASPAANTTGEENTIAPPSITSSPADSEGALALPATAEPASTLPAPEEPIAALPAPEEPVAQLPAVAETPAILAAEEPQPSAPSPSDEEPPAQDVTPDEARQDTDTAALPPTSTPPEQ